MYKSIIKFHDTVKYKSPILITNIDINKIDKQDFKYFIGFKDNKEIRNNPEMSIYKTKYMYFMIKDENFFDKYMAIWKKVSNIIIKKINSEI